jgi:hypothetical protein
LTSNWVPNLIDIYGVVTHKAANLRACLVLVGPLLVQLDHFRKSVHLVTVCLEVAEIRHSHGVWLVSALYEPREEHFVWGLLLEPLPKGLVA